MCADRISRRSFLAASCSAIAVSSWSEAHALGRTALGGKISMHVPWPTGSIDPHRIDDATAAIFGEAIFDTLYAKDEHGNVIASLAEADPEVAGNDLRIAFRSGITSARGKTIDARDAAFSIARARNADARGWLAEIPQPRVEGRSTLVFAMKDAAKLTRALASSLVSIVPSNFTALWPDGTGPFRAEHRGDGVLLRRNANAARGASFLDEIFVHPASDLSASLRAFESGADAIGWLGLGSHDPRANARAFDVGAVGWAILRTGREAGSWDAPGVAQVVANAIPHARLAYLAVGAPWTASPAQGGSSLQDAWGGPACTLIVRDDSAWLVELARVVAALISRPGHEVTAKPVAYAELEQRRASRALALAIDVARPFASGTWGALAGLAIADDPAAAESLGKHPPRIGESSPRTLTRAMRIGVVGEIRVQGGRIPELTLASSTSGYGFDLGASTLARGAGS